MASRYTNASSFDSTSSTDHSSRALIKKSSTSNLGSIMKKLIDTKSKSHGGSSSKIKPTHQPKSLYIPADFIAEDLKKNKAVGSGFSTIQKKLFKGLKGKKEGERKALMDVKNSNANTNTRTLAMVLRSERELLIANKDQDLEIIHLKLLLEEKNREVEKLKDLCLKQREEIKYLKNSILFPDVNVMDSHIKVLMEKQSSELRQAKQLIPSLQRQVTSLTGQLQCIAEDLAEVKADKIYYGKGSYEANVRSPTSQGYYTEEASNSLEFSTTPGSPDDLLHRDLNPCLTPYTAKTKSKEFEVDDSVEDEWLLTRYNMQRGDGVDFCYCNREVSKSSDRCHCIKAAKDSYRAACRSHESKRIVRKQMHYKQF